MLIAAQNCALWSLVDLLLSSRRILTCQHDHQTHFLTKNCTLGESTGRVSTSMQVAMDQ